MRMAAWCALLLALGCESSKPAGGTGADPSGTAQVPQVKISDQRGVKRGGDAGSRDNQILPGLGGETDGREVDAGVGFRAEAKKGCSDTPCIGANCARLCTQWTNENPPKTPDLRTKVYLGCLGMCLPEADP